VRTERLAAVGLVCGLLVPAISHAAPELELRLEADGVRLGDRVAVELVARGGADLMWGDLAVQIPDGGEWAVVDGPAERPGSAPPAWTVTLVPLAVGELDLPAMAVGARTPDGTVERIAAAPRTVTVGSVLAEDDALEPAGLKPPIGVSGLPWEWIVPGLVMLLPLVAVAAWWRVRAGQSVGDGAGVVLSPAEELERALGELTGAIGRESPEAVCDRLAFSLRRYLERRTGEPALEMTSVELVALARRSDWPSLVQQRLRQATGVADEVRFARRARGDEVLGQAADGVREMASALEDHLRPAIDEEAA
jgi:hypothetical protein